MGIGMLDKMKIMKEAAKMGVGGMKTKVDELQQTEKDFKEKELAILEKFEDKLESIIKTQKTVLAKLNSIEQVVK